MTREELDAAIADPIELTGTAGRQVGDWSRRSVRSPQPTPRPLPTGPARCSRESRGVAVRTYLVLAAAEFRRFSTYRLAILAGVTTQSVFGFIRVGILFAAISSAGGIASCRRPAVGLDLRLARPGAAGPHRPVGLDRDCRARQQR